MKENRYPLNFNESRISNKRHPERDLHSTLRRQGARRTQQGAEPNRIRRRGHISGQGAKDNARIKCGVCQHRSRKGRIHTLSRFGQSVRLAAEGGKQPPTRQTGHQGRDHEARTKHRKNRQARLVSSGRTDHNGTDSQGGNLNQRPAPYGRHIARWTQCRTRAIHLEDIHIAKDTLERNEETAPSDRGRNPSQELRCHHTHGCGRGPRRRYRARHTRPSGALEHCRRQHPQEPSPRAAHERDEPRKHHNQRLAQFDFFADHRRRRSTIPRNQELHKDNRSPTRKDRQTIPRHGTHIRQLRHIEADQVVVRQVCIAQARRLPHHRTYGGHERHRRQLGQPHKG